MGVLMSVYVVRLAAFCMALTACSQPPANPSLPAKSNASAPLVATPANVPPQPITPTEVSDIQPDGGCPENCTESNERRWSVSPTSTFELSDESYNDYPSAKLEFFIEGNEIFSRTDPKKSISKPARGYSVYFSCDESINDATIRFLYDKDDTAPDDFFVPDEAAQIQPSRGNWKRSQDRYAMALLTGTNYPLAPQLLPNYVSIQAILGEMIRNGSVKVGTLPPISFKQKNSILDKIAVECRVN